MKRYQKMSVVLALLLSLLLALGGCGDLPETNESSIPSTFQSEATIESTEGATQPTKAPETIPPTTAETSTEAITETTIPETTVSYTGPSESGSFTTEDVPAYSGKAYISVNGGTPYFTDEDLSTQSFEYYSPLDAYGRCGTAFANIGRDIMPTEERGSIGQVKPAGWHTVKYDCVDGKYLYNRCHLIGYQLSGENANTSNLITGTRYLNIEGMLPFENMVADYVKETDNHVLYRVTPIHDGDNLLCYGVLMEGWSVEDSGDGIGFCVFAYNVQPGVVIDYATGDSYAEEQPTEPETTAAPETDPPTEAPETEPPTEAPEEPQGVDYILNINSKKFHYPDCPSVKRMKESNKEYYTGSRDDLIAMGYDPCKNCNP